MTEETRFQSIDEVFDDMYQHIPDPDPIRRAEARQALLAHVDARLSGQVSTTTFRDTGSPEIKPSGLTSWFSGFVDTFKRQRRVMIMLEIIVAIILAGTALIGGVTIAADGAGPGDPMYGIDRTVENIRGSLILNEDAQANFQAKLATERLIEAEDDEYSDEALDGLDQAIVVLTELLDSGNLSPETQAGLEATLTDLTTQRDSLDNNLNGGDNSTGVDDSADDASGTNDENSSSSDQSNTSNDTSSAGDDSSTSGEDSSSDDASSTSGEDSSSGDESDTDSGDDSSDEGDDSSDEGDDSDDEDDDSSSIDGSLGIINNSATDSNTGNTGNTVDSSPSPDTGGNNSGSDDSNDDHGDDHHDDDHHEDDHDDEGDDD